MVRSAYWIFIIFCCIGYSNTLSGQIKGRVTDPAGDPLPFANIYVENTSKGTTSNLEGVFYFELEPGDYRIVFQYVGFHAEVKSISVGSEPIDLSVELRPETVELQEVEVKANAEDPAYRIIRAAIKKRKYYKTLVETFKCRAYVKGMQKLKDAPEKFMGQDLGNLGGILDSNRQGILYLSESESEIYFQQPDREKEIMLSSKVSGSDNGFSFNRSTFLQKTLYESHQGMERQIISPIAGSALDYYKYQLEGAFYDNQNRLVNKIKVIPRRPDDPVYAGYIYIVEDLWCIHSAELFVTGATVRIPVLDTLFIRQVYVPVAPPDKWMLLSTHYEFGFGLFGFQVDGFFTGVFSDYDLAPRLPKNFFGPEVFKVGEEANKKDSIYWDNIRPIPLTAEEEADYVRKDSLEKIWTSKEFRDSIDRKFNKFTVLNLLLGYSYRNTYKQQFFNFNSPLNTVHFNTVQGWNARLDFSYLKEFDDPTTKWLRISPSIHYGFADKILRLWVMGTYQFNSLTFNKLSFGFGNQAAQFNPEDPVNYLLNDLYTLVDKRNYLKIYSRTGGFLSYEQEVRNGLYLTGTLEYYDRQPLYNRTDYSWTDQVTPYSSNSAVYNQRDELYEFEQHQALALQLSMRLRINQRYESFPGRKEIEGSKYPDIWVHYRKGIAAFGSDVNYDLVSARIKDQYTLGLVGTLGFNVHGGTFLNNARTELMDFQHFIGNQTFVGNPSNYLSRFHMLPYYDYSTSTSFLETHVEHNFTGFLLDKIPVLRKLRFYTVVGGKALILNDGVWYSEVYAGFDNVGISLLRFLRVDVVSSFVNGKYEKTGFMLGIKL